MLTSILLAIVYLQINMNFIVSKVGCANVTRKTENATNRLVTKSYQEKVNKKDIKKTKKPQDTMQKK